MLMERHQHGAELPIVTDNNCCFSTALCLGPPMVTHGTMLFDIVHIAKCLNDPNDGQEQMNLLNYSPRTKLP